MLTGIMCPKPERCTQHASDSIQRPSTNVSIGLTFIVRKIVNVSKTIARGLHI